MQTVSKHVWFTTEISHSRKKDIQKIHESNNNIQLLQCLRFLQEKLNSFISVSKQNYNLRMSTKLSKFHKSLKVYWSLLKTFLNNNNNNKKITHMWRRWAHLRISFWYLLKNIYWYFNIYNVAFFLKKEGKTPVDILIWAYSLIINKMNRSLYIFC